MSRQQVRRQLNSGLEGEGLAISEEKLYNMKIPSRDLKIEFSNVIRSLDAFVNSLSHSVV